MLEIIKVFNNNVCQVLNEDGCEEIVMGKGLGFGKRQGDVVNLDGIEKKFILNKDSNIESVKEIFDRIEPEYIEISIDIINLAKEKLGKRFNDMILITLSDHISYAVERFKKGISMTNPLEWDIKYIYPDEYNFSIQAIEFINQSLDIELPISEAAFVALHFVSAYEEMSVMEDTLLITNIVKEIISITNYHYKTNLNETSYTFLRFIAHIRYFIKRQLYSNNTSEEKSMINVNFDDMLFEYECALKIKNYLEKEYRWTISSDEIVYLVVHLNRLSAEL